MKKEKSQEVIETTEIKDNKPAKSKKHFKFSISLYLATLMGGIIIAVALILMLITMGNIKNLVGEYESDADRLQNYIAAILAQSLKHDIKKNNYSTTQSLLEYYKSENLLVYAYITDNRNDKIILGEQTHNEDTERKIREIPRTIGNYTLYYAIESQDKLSRYHSSLIELVGYALILIVVIGVIASIIFASIISKPLQDVSKAAKEITEGKFDVEIKDSNFAEIDDLIASYNEICKFCFSSNISSLVDIAIYE